MDTAALKKFAQSARRSLMEQVATKIRVVLAKDSLARREHSAAVSKLEALIQEHDEGYVVEKIAYIWFNRFSALRFMDVNHYTSVGIVSPAESQSQPEILAEAKMGHIDPEIVPPAIRQRIHDLLGNKVPSANPQAEAYRLLLVAACNTWNQAMPFLFQKIDDYTELLLPEDLLSEQSILTQLRSVMTEKSCQDVEIIGWLYQFYISEKKDEVFDGLKKNKKITPENIPAATQLFTPHWIVRYLVENSLGRLWMLNHPDSDLAAQMDYYIKPEQPETEFLKINSPEGIKICDPACGSGHMLVYAFDLLYAIYEEEGYDATEIPAKILTHNLYGIEIDERAGELAAFALTMKARSKQRNFFRQQIRPNVCVLENVKFEPGELKDYMNVVGRDLFTMQLQNTLHQFEEADNFGSLIRPDLIDVEPMVQFLNAKNVGSDLFHNKTHLKVMKVLEQAEYLRSKYHVVIANPPYMGGKGMNGRLVDWSKKYYLDSKSDLYSMFMERIFTLTYKCGYAGIMTPFSWMFLSSFKNMRVNILKSQTIIGLVRPEYHAFFESAYVPICAFLIYNNSTYLLKGTFIDLNQFYGADSQSTKLLEALTNPDCGWLYRVASDEFKKIPGSPIAYWVNKKILRVFSEGTELGKIGDSRSGMQTGNNDLFLRQWFEVGYEKIGFGLQSLIECKINNYKWIPHTKGGAYRKWYGNFDYVVNFENQGEAIRNYVGTGLVKNPGYYFREGVSWSHTTVKGFASRYLPTGFIFNVEAPSYFTEKNIFYLLGLLNTKITDILFGYINQTFHYLAGDMARIPVLFATSEKSIEILNNVRKMIEIAKQDWDLKELSWHFLKSPLVCSCESECTLKSIYTVLRIKWHEMLMLMKNLEKLNNSLFIELYNLQGELNPEVDNNEITLNINPYFQYGIDKTEVELEALLLADTMREFFSYAVGCMFGRYSLDKPGLILANQGETLADYLAQIPSPTFMPDEDNVIPILDGEWFADDIVDRFRQFLRVTFGVEHFAENLKFIEDAIGKDIRSFFLKDFYSDHLKRYKKRPIYWLFSSPKGTFNALIYMHRYRPDTVSIVLNKYLREFKLKLSSRIEHLNRMETSINTSKADKTRAIKEREALKKNLDELDAWERDVLFPLALEQKEIDLDDGVKANYPKFGAALKKIPGLDTSEE